MAVVPELLCALPPALPLAEWPGLTLLAAMVWSEARGEPFEGQLAVAWTPLTRLAAHNAWPSTLHGVLLQPKQFQGLAAPKVATPLKADSAEAWFLANKAAAAALFGFQRPASFRRFPTHFLRADTNPMPEWVSKLTRVGQIGSILFLA